MNHNLWTKIIADIESEHAPDGEGYKIEVRTKSGYTLLDCAWQPLGVRAAGVPYEAIILSWPNDPPVYMPLDAIESVAVSS